MTWQYSEVNPDDALYNLARRYPGSVEALAARLGRTPAVFRKQIMPSLDTHHLSPDDFRTIIEICAAANVPDAYQPLHALCFSLGHVAVAMPGVTAGSEIFNEVLHMLSAEGVLAGNIQSALADDGKINKTELDEIEKSLEKAVSALATVRELVRAKHKNDFNDVPAVHR